MKKCCITEMQFTVFLFYRTFSTISACFCSFSGHVKLSSDKALGCGWTLFYFLRKPMELIWGSGAFLEEKKCSEVFSLLCSMLAKFLAT